MEQHPGYLDHSDRATHVAIPATILCCPIRGQVYPVTLTCLQEYGRESVVYRWLDPDNAGQMQYGMRQAILDFWGKDQDLIHVDHDMVFTWDSLRDLSNCEGDFCVCPSYYIDSWITASLGFCKFSVELQRKVNMWDIILSHDTCWDTPEMKGCHGAWWGFEYHVMEELKKHVTNPCQHNPVLNDHSFWGLNGSSETLHDKMRQVQIVHDPGTPQLTVDTATSEGRAELVKYLRKELGWSLPEEPS